MNLVDFLPAPADPLCVMCRVNPYGVCEDCGKQFCENHGERCRECGGLFCEQHMDTYSCYHCRDIVLERRRQRAQERAQERLQNIEMKTSNLLEQFAEQKSAESSQVIKKAFKLNSSLDKIKTIVEKKRDKGGGFLKKKPEEKLSYIRLVLLPCVIFEYQYLKKKGLFGSKVPHHKSTILSPSEPPKQFWYPELVKEKEEDGLVDIEEGYLIPMDLETAEERVARFMSIAIYSPDESSIWKKNLNLDTSPEDVQRLSKVNIAYLPIWIAKLQTPNTTRYLVYDRYGKEHKEMAEKINTNYQFAQELEKNAVKL